MFGRSSWGCGAPDRGRPLDWHRLDHFGTSQLATLRPGHSSLEACRFSSELVWWRRSWLVEFHAASAMPVLGLDPVFNGQGLVERLHFLELVAK